MPKMGESIIEATILKWNKQTGDEVEQEESLLEIATDKVDSEVPSPADGKLLEIMFQEGDVVPVGEIIAIIETESETADHTPSTNGHTPEEIELVEEVPFVPQTQGAIHLPEEKVQVVGEGRFYSPLVLNIARKEGISMTELESLSGSGRSGRVTKKDILNYVQTRSSESLDIKEEESPALVQSSAPLTKPAVEESPMAPPPSKETNQTVATKSFKHSGEMEIVEMDRMRKMIAENMIYSTQVSAHVTSFVEADVTNIVLWRKRVKNEFLEKHREKLTFTPIFIQAVAQALKEFPMVNASVEGERILIKKDINIGIAVALPTDNLIVPVIKHADRMNLLGLTATVNDLAERARNKQLKAHELEGGTYTLSNVGTFGNVMGTPIIMQPQLAILATGAIRKIPAVIETPQGDMIGIRHKMFLSHSYDHRIIDGALGGRFVKRVADILEEWKMDTEI